MSAIKHMQTIHNAQAFHYEEFGRYATALSELSLPADLAAGSKAGYTFAMRATPQGYAINARPVVFNKTYRRTFYSDQSLLIRENWGPEPATAESQELSTVR